DAAGEKAAIGAGVAVTVVNDSALATTARDIDSGGAVVFAAHADATSEASAKASAKGGKEEKQDGSPDDTPEDGVDQEVAKQTTFGKTKQAAGSNNAGQQPGSAQTSEGKVSVAAAVGVNVAASKARAFIPDAREVDAAGPLTVEASNNTDAAAAADGSAAGSTATVGIGAAVAVNS